MVSYGLLGGFAGIASATFVRLFATTWVSALLSWLFAVGLLLVSWQLLRPDRRVVTIKRQPSRRWRAKIVAHCIAVVRGNPLCIGAVSALLPCGALAAGLALAATTASAGAGALVMLGFATTTALALFSVRWVTGHISQHYRRYGVRCIAAVFVVGAAIFIYRPIPSLLAPNPTVCPLHVETTP